MLEDLITQLSHNSFDPALNFNVAADYHQAGQIASAVTFYLRAAEYGEDSQPNISYAALLRLSKCFDSQNDRVTTVSNCILQAIALIPYRAEAYFWLARFYERHQKWQDCYTAAQMGLHQTVVDPKIDLEFNDYCLLFEKGVAAFWIGRKEESKQIMSHLTTRNLSPEYRQTVEANLENLI